LEVFSLCALAPLRALRETKNFLFVFQLPSPFGGRVGEGGFKQQTTNNKQQTTNNKQQTTNNKRNNK